jgi:3-oxoacyl-[acyl-carrier protein] reductase/meso-butanediol dehydrogenase/(S,S)-butanediol dehydrogenase/diacetyl reductase
VAIVTGAGRLRSIGRMIALELARNGVNVTLTGTGRSPDRYPPDEKEVGWRDIDSVADEIRAAGAKALPLVSDIGSPGDVDEMIKRTLDEFGRIDILVNNAGFARGPDRLPVVELDPAIWMKVQHVNVNGTFFACRAVGRYLVERGEGGRIINISSIASKLAPPATAAYAASKAAIDALSHAMAWELAPHQITVNAICPGVVDTARMDDLGREERWQETIRAAIPMGWASDGMDIAYVAAFLCSDMGKWITGQAINVDGGRAWG